MELQDLRELLEKEEESNNINLREILNNLIKHWKWFVISLVVCLTAGFVYSLKQTPTYRVNAVILIKSKEGSSPLKGQMDFMADMDIMGSKDNVLDEIQILNSKLLLTKVVNQLGLHTSYFQSKGLKKVKLYQKSPIAVSMLPENLDTLKAPIVLKFSSSDNQLTIKGKMKTGRFDSYEFEKTTSSLPVAIPTPMGVIRVQGTPGDLSNNLEVVLESPISAASRLQKELTIALADKKANAVQISTTSKDIKEAKDIINSLIRFYNDASIEEKNKTAQNTIRFIDDRLALITGDLTQVEKRVEDYKQANKLTDIKAESEQFIKQNGDFEKMRLDIATQINLVQFVDQYIRKEGNQYGIVPNIGLKDESLLSVLKEYNTILFQRERLIRTTSAENPTIIDLDRQIRAMRQAIFASIESSRRGLLITQQNLDRQNNINESRIESVPRQEREYIEIKRQQELKAALYTYLLQKREENSLTLAITVPAARIIETPIPDEEPASKGTSFFLGIAFLIGLILPVILIVVKEMLSVHISEKSQFERMTDVSILGELPDYKGEDPVVVRPGNREPIAEMYRLLRTNLQFILHDKHKKVINVTSTEPGEGKSTFTINLAMTLALTGKKVLMIGLDIRKPALAEYINIKENQGITSYLSGHIEDHTKLIQESKIHENLHILPAGTVPPNPNELLLKDSLDELFDTLRKEYDYIVVDTAPVGLVSDTFLLDRVADATLYIFRLNYSHKNNINIINDIDKKKKLKNMYIALKGCDLSLNPYGYGKGKNGYYGK